MKQNSTATARTMTSSNRWSKSISLILRQLLNGKSKCVDRIYFNMREFPSGPPAELCQNTNLEHHQGYGDVRDSDPARPGSTRTVVKKAPPTRPKGMPKSFIRGTTPPLIGEDIAAQPPPQVTIPTSTSTTPAPHRQHNQQLTTTSRITFREIDFEASTTSISTRWTSTEEGSLQGLSQRIPCSSTTQGSTSSACATG